MIDLHIYHLHDTFSWPFSSPSFFQYLIQISLPVQILFFVPIPAFRDTMHHWPNAMGDDHISHMYCRQNLQFAICHSATLFAMTLTFSFPPAIPSDAIAKENISIDRIDKHFLIILLTIYNVITLYLGTSVFIITQPMRYEVAQTQKMMK